MEWYPDARPYQEGDIVRRIDNPDAGWIMRDGKWVAFDKFAQSPTNP